MQGPTTALKRRHKGRDGLSNHQPHDCLLNCLFKTQLKENSSASLAFVRGIHRWPVNSQQEGPVTRKMFPFDDVIMHSTCNNVIRRMYHPYLFDQVLHWTPFVCWVIGKWCRHKKHQQQIDFNTLRQRQNGPHFLTIFSNAFSCMKIYQFRFHWSLFPSIQITISQHWFR